MCCRRMDREQWRRRLRGLAGCFAGPSRGFAARGVTIPIADCSAVLPKGLTEGVIARAIGQNDLLAFRGGRGPRAT